MPRTKSKVTLRLTISQSVCFGVEPTLGLVTRYYFLSEGCCLKVAVLSLLGALSDERSGMSTLFISLLILKNTDVSPSGGRQRKFLLRWARQSERVLSTSSNEPGSSCEQETSLLYPTGQGSRLASSNGPKWIDFFDPLQSTNEAYQITYRCVFQYTAQFMLGCFP
jgi:hypothetical protein